MCDLYLWYLTLGAQHTPAHTQLSPDTAQWFSATRVRDEKERNETGDGDRCATATVCCEDARERRAFEACGTALVGVGRLASRASRALLKNATSTPHTQDCCMCGPQARSPQRWAPCVCRAGGTFVKPRVRVRRRGGAFVKPRVRVSLCISESINTAVI